MRTIWKIALAAVPPVIVLLVLAAFGSYHTGSRACAKCGLSHTSRYLEIGDFVVWDASHTDYSPLPALRAGQQACLHSWGGHGKTVSLGGTELGSGRVSTVALRLAADCADGNLQPAIDCLCSFADYPDEAGHAAYFIQIASGVDFGLTFDDANRQAVVPVGALLKIYKWADPNLR